MRDFKDIKIAVAGTGYVGLSIATDVYKRQCPDYLFDILSGDKKRKDEGAYREYPVSYTHLDVYKRQPHLWQSVFFQSAKELRTYLVANGKQKE